MLHFNRKTRLSAQVLAPHIPSDYQVNWGNSWRSMGGEGIDLNKPESVAKAVNKLKALQILQDNDVSIPKLWGLDYDIDYPVIARTPRHSKGRGLWLCRDYYDLNQAIRKGANHFLEYIPDALEFRVHVFLLDKYRSIKLSEKTGGEGIVRTHSNGYRFVVPIHRDEAKIARREAKRAVEALNLDFGAVDVLVKDGIPYVLEVNSAPCLTDPNSDTLQRYVDKIAWRYANREEI